MRVLMKTSVLSGYGKIRLSFIDRPVNISFEHFQEIEEYHDINHKPPYYTTRESVVGQHTIFTLDLEQEFKSTKVDEKYISDYELFITKLCSTIHYKPSFIFQTNDSNLSNKKFFCIGNDLKLPVEPNKTFSNFETLDLITYDFDKGLKIYVT